MEAVRPDLLREDILVHNPKAHPLKEARLIGQGEHSTDPKLPRFHNTRLHQATPDPTPLMSALHRQGSDLGQILPNDMEAAAPDHLPALFVLGGEDIPQIGVKVTEGSCQKLPLLRKLSEHPLDVDDVSDSCLAYHPA